MAAAGALVNNIGKKTIFKNCATDFISKINNTQADSAKDIDAVMSMCNLIEYRVKLFKNIKKFTAVL